MISLDVLVISGMVTESGSTMMAGVVTENRGKIFGFYIFEKKKDHTNKNDDSSIRAWLVFFIDRL